MSDYIPGADLAFQQFATIFVTEAQGAGTTYGLSAPQIAALTSALADFDLAFSDSESSRTQFKISTTQKKEKRAILESKIRAAAGIIQNDADTTNTVRNAFHIPERGNPATSPPVFMPTALLVGGYSDGTNRLEWNRNGNTSGTSFFVEYTVDLGTTWLTAGITTKTQFNHEGNTPGQKTGYRVSAVRASKSSLPSQVAWIYANNFDQNVTLLQAA